MPKGKRKRTAEEYDKEILETIKRLKKHREYLKSAKESSTWLSFLDKIGITVETEAREDYFEKVRQAISPPKPVKVKTRITDYKPIQYDRALIKPSLIYHDKKGRFTSKVTAKVSVVYRDAETKKVITHYAGKQRLENA